MKSIINSSYTYAFLFFTLFLLLPLILSLSPPSPPPPPPKPRRCHPNDELALLELKSHFGNNLPIFSSWTPTTDCCNKWSGVLCKKIPKTQIHRVNFLELFDSNDIVGTIPSTLHKLPYLESLILRLLPNLTGPIPPVISKLTNLQYLSLNWDSLTGPIPSFLSKLTNLVTLSLNNNYFTGSIPPFLGHLPYLSGLDLDDNKLTGSIPETFGLFRNNTPVSLHLENNNLSGSIPRTLGSVNFDIINLSNNRFVGDASFLFGEDKTSLENLILSNNGFAFNFSNVVMPVGESSIFYTLDVSHNEIYGSLPEWIGEAPILDLLDVSYNRLCGRIPIPKGRAEAAFDASSFQHNLCLCGSPLPPCKN